MEFASCYLSGTKNFEVAFKCLENLCTPVLNNVGGTSIVTMKKTADEIHIFV
jgi:hypothetical protein